MQSAACHVYAITHRMVTQRVISLVASVSAACQLSCFAAMSCVVDILTWFFLVWCFFRSCFSPELGFSPAGVSSR